MDKTCGWKEDDRLACSDPADGGEVTIAGPTGEAIVPVCRRHRAVHNQRAALLRTAAKK